MLRPATEFDITTNGASLVCNRDGVRVSNRRDVRGGRIVMAVDLFDNFV